MKSNAKVLVAFLAGIAAGASLGILFAPDKGCETRKKIKDGVSELKDKAVEEFEALKKKVNKMKHEGEE